MSESRNTVLSLQFARGLAATLVVISHAIDYSGNFGRSHIGSFYSFENFGAIGVDIFFVISGAIMTIITNSGSIPPGKFLLKRCIRVLPLYWAISAFCILLWQLGYWQPIKPAEVLQTLTLIPFFKSGYNAGHILFLGWTLSFEFYFYLVFAIVLFIKSNKVFYVVLALLLLPVLAGLAVKGFTDERLRFFTNPIILEFLAGCFCGYLYLSKKQFPKWVAYTLTAAGMFLMLFSVIRGFGYISEMEFTWNASLSIKRFALWGIPSFLLIGGLMLLEKNKAFYTNRLFITVGNISYAAYLSHMFTIMAFTAAWHHAGFKAPDLFIVTAIPLCLFVAYLIYRYIEKPIIAYLNRMAFKKME